MGEYGDEEIQDDNEEIGEEQELDENISNNQEINIEDFEPINEQDIELEGENFEPSYSIETDIHDFQFEIPNNITFKNTYEEFEPIHGEKNVLECRPPNLNTSWIKAIINDPTLTTSEKIEKLEKKKSKLWDNSELSISKRRRISKAIDGAISKLKGARGGMLNSSISPNRDAAGKHDTSNLNDNQNTTQNEINNQEDMESEQSEKLKGQHNNEHSKDYKEENNDNQENLLENQTAKIKNEKFNNKEILNKIYNHISEFSPKFLEYIKYTTKRGKIKFPNSYPNRGIRITNKFKDWIKNNEIDPFKTKKYLAQIEQINNSNDIQEIIKYNITSTNKSQKGISRSLKVYGLNISPPTIRKIALKHVYNNDQKQMNKRFPTDTGGFLQETYSLNKNRITFENIEVLQEKFIQYHEYAKKNNLKTKYANRGAKITTLFINWIHENEKNLELRNKLINAAKKVNENGEIPQYVMEKTIKSNLSMRAISNELKEKGIYLSHHAIGDYARDHVLENEYAKIERFPSPTEIISNELYEKIKEEVKKFYPIPQRWISKKLGVSRTTIERIAKKENTKEEYERKWPAREKISDVTRNSIINDIKKTNLNMIQIADKHDISPNSVKRYAKEFVFKDENKSYENRFPNDVYRLLGTLTHYCILDELTLFFRKYHKETLFAEPKIYPSNSKGSDGLILNDQNFLQKRLKDPNNTNDLSFLIHNIPTKSLNTQFDHIKAIQFDLTNDVTDNNIIRKCLKYQRPDLMLYIVGTRWYPYDLVKPLPKDKSIIYHENIKVISHELFTDLIGLQGKTKEHFEQIIDLNDNVDIDTLTKIHELNNIKWNNKIQLRRELKQKGLIKRSINEYFKIPTKYEQKTLF